MEDESQWCIVELLGHVKLAGKLSEVEKFGVKLGRLDIPQGDGFVTRLFGGSSVYCITPVTEAVARHVVKQITVAPVSPWDFPKQLPAPRTDGFTDQDDETDNYTDSEIERDFNAGRS